MSDLLFYGKVAVDGFDCGAGIDGWNDLIIQTAVFLRRQPSRNRETLMGCLHDPANVQQSSSKCIQNTRANAGRLLDVCWIV